MDKDTKRLAFGHKALRFAAWLSIAWVALVIFRVYLLPQWFERLATQHEGLCSWVPLNVLYDGLMAYLPGALSAVLPIVIVLVSIVAFLNIKRGEPLRGKAVASLYASIALAFWVVLFSASLTSVPGKGPSSVVKANMAGIRGQAELFWDVHGGYGPPVSTCFAEGSLFAQRDISRSICSVISVSRRNEVVCRATEEAYVVSAPLPSNRGLESVGHWCIDSFGNATTTKSAPTGLSCVN